MTTHFSNNGSPFPDWVPRSALLALLCLLAQNGARAQADKPPLPSEAYSSEAVVRHDFDQKKWEALKEGIDYAGKKKDKNKPEEKEAPAPEPKPMTGLAPAFKYSSIAVAIGILVYLFVKLSGGKDLFGPKNSKLRPAVSAAEIEKIEENLHEAELADPIRRAIAAADYPLAVRLYYLAMLKELAARNHIRWKREKTNGAYLRELAGSPLFGTVQEVTLAFERVWYGKVDLSTTDFEQLEIKLKKAVSTVSA